MQVDVSQIESLKKDIDAKRAEIMRDWTPDKCPEEHKEGWLVWEYALRKLVQAGASEDDAAQIRSIWVQKVRNGFYGTYGAVVMMLSTPAIII